MKKFLISKETYDKLKKEINALREEEPEVKQRIAEAREHGDLSENAEYHSARERLAFIEARIGQIGIRLSNCEIIDPKKIKTDKVNYGVSVKLENKKTRRLDVFKVVGDGEADPDKDEISVSSPIGTAIWQKKEGECVTVKLPLGEVVYKIKKIFVKK